MYASVTRLPSAAMRAFSATLNSTTDCSSAVKGCWSSDSKERKRVRMLWMAPWEGVCRETEEGKEGWRLVTYVRREV